MGTLGEMMTGVAIMYVLTSIPAIMFSISWGPLALKGIPDKDAWIGEAAEIISSNLVLFDLLKPSIAYSYYKPIGSIMLMGDCNNNWDSFECYLNHKGN